MKQFSHNFTLIPPSQISGQWRQSLQLVATPSCLDIMAKEPVIFSQENQFDAKGSYYNMTFRAVVGADSTSLMEFNGQRAVIRIRMTDGTTTLVGTKEDAPLIRVTPLENVYVVDASYASPVPIPL